MIELLLEQYVVTGVVKHGEKVGQTIGFPTANLDVDVLKISLDPGVYFCRSTITLEDKTAFTDIPGLAYFGPRFIFNEKVNSFEVYLYDFDRTIYDYTVTATLTHFLRPPKEIRDLATLKTQLEEDKITGLRLIQS